MSAKRLDFIDQARGLAIILMIINHTARYWLTPNLAGRSEIIYWTVTLAGPLFLFLVGLVLPFSFGQSGGLLSRWQILAKYSRRAIIIWLAGGLLNLTVYYSQPWYRGTVLHTIALAIMLAGPLLMANRRWPKVTPGLVLAASLVWLAGFYIWLEPLAWWLSHWPLVATVLFAEFAPWPSLAFVGFGLVVGWRWQKYQSSPLVLARFIKKLFWTGVALLGGYLLLQLIGDYHWWGFGYDLVLNGYWLPRPLTLYWIIGMILVICSSLAVIAQTKYAANHWLKLLGQSALFIYLWHQWFLVVTIYWLKSLPTFGYYILLTGLFIGLMVYSAKIWQFARRLVYNYFQL